MRIAGWWTTEPAGGWGSISLFDPALPEVLSELEVRDDLFDVVVLQRRSPRRRFAAGSALPSGHVLGRVRFSDYGSNDYVITRAAAGRFLERIPRMVREIDQALSRFQDNGLDVLYVPRLRYPTTKRLVPRSRSSATRNAPTIGPHGPAVRIVAAAGLFFAPPSW